MQKQYVISSKHLIMPSLYRASNTFTDRWTSWNLHRIGGLQITPLSVNVTLYFTDDREKCLLFSFHVSCLALSFHFPEQMSFSSNGAKRLSMWVFKLFQPFQNILLFQQPLTCVRVDMIKISWRVWKLFTPWWSFINGYISPWFCILMPDSGYNWLLANPK